ncbi:endosome-associated-trafficking regulator 1 isoform X3 [Gadus chalcogrammus]|uniref:endosome-associated-trafficking regulator 1 isoform X3 n=1 Tax=Gadus chalcogrammus TaxID=1042646 RepID=UPI0024C250DC|nr:endosome-associated-trafficking regulator 1 isoform X3 [Gadus chalcogrammus]
MSKNKSSAKTLLIVDGDDEVQEAELNPFSFREFVRHHGPAPGSEETSGSYRRKVHDTTSSQSRTPTFAPAMESSFFWEPLRSVLRAQDEEGGAESGLAAAAAEEEEEGDRSSSLWLPDEDQEEEEAKEISRTGGRGGEDYEGDDETTILETPNSLSRKSSMQQLQEENMVLRRSVSDLHKSSSAYKERIQQLSEELIRRGHEEEKEAQALESMVHSVEQNLQLMTKRAVKAESGVSKLKQELQQLQGHMEIIKLENERLLAEQLETMKAMKQNARTAADYLGKTAIQARSSIKQLLGEAENLHLVSQLLQSIDKISTHTSDIH